MANKSWTERLNPFARESSEIKELKSKVNELTEKMDLSTYDSKFLDIGPTSSGAFETFNNPSIDQQLDIRALQKIFVSEVWVYAATMAVAKTIAGLPIKIEKKKITSKKILNEDGQEEIVKEESWIDATASSIAKLFDKPNKNVSKAEFYHLLIIDLLTAGEYFLYLHSDKNLEVIENAESQNEPDGAFDRLRAAMTSTSPVKAMYRIPPYNIKPLVSEDKYDVEGYLMVSDAHQYSFSPAEIIHVKFANPLDSHVGLSPLVAAFKEVLLDRYSTEHMVRFYKSGARLGGVIETEKSLNKEQVSRFTRSFESNYTGRHNHHRTLVLPPGMTYKQIEQNPAETALLDFCRYNREAVLSAFGVPPIKVGIMDQANYANALVQLKVFFTDTIIPHLTFIEEGFNSKACLMPGNASFRMKFDLSNVEALQENNKDKAETAKTMLEAGLTVDEVRKKVWDLDPIEGGNKAPTVEAMSNSGSDFIPFSSRAANVQDTKDAVSPPQAITSDIIPTTVTYSIRVAQLTQQFMDQGLPLSVAIAKAIEQALTEGFDPEDPDNTPTPPKDTSEDKQDSVSHAEIRPTLIAGPGPKPPKEEDEGKKKKTLTEFLLESIEQLSPKEEITKEFLDELVAIYNAQYGEALGILPTNESKEVVVSTTQDTTPRDVQEIPHSVIYGFGFTKEIVAEHWKTFNDKSIKLMEERKKEVDKFFRKYKSIIANRLGANIKSFGAYKSISNDDIDSITSLDALDTLIADYIAEVDSALLKAYAMGFEETAVNIEFKVQNEKAIAALKKYAAKSVTSITETTRDQMKALLTEAAEDGVSLIETAMRLQEKFDEITKGRAETIARTETLTAVSIGQEEKRQEVKAQFPDSKMKKMWVTAKDDRVRDSHQELEGESVDSEASFSNGLKFPRDPDGEASEVINCRCTTVDFVADDEALIRDTIEQDNEKA